MQPKPDFLGQCYASAFQEASVAEAYQARPPYPDAVFDLLAGLMGDQPRKVLDAGCGTGFLARPLAARVAQVAHIDAVDISPVMTGEGKAVVTWRFTALDLDAWRGGGCATRSALCADYRW